MLQGPGGLPRAIGTGIGRKCSRLLLVKSWTWLNKGDTASLAALILAPIDSAELQPGVTHGLGFAHS
jgi:hypothetical protein